MVDHETTLIWEGEIQYGRWKASTWYSVGGWNHPLFQKYLNEVKANSHLFEGFNLYITGGLLEDWQSWDIDWILTGPYDPSKIKPAMELITEVGFNLGLYPDVHYSRIIFSLYDWQRDGKSYSDWVYELSNVFIKDGVQTDMSFCHPVDGMFKRWNNYPFQKNLERHNSGYKYHQPVQIF
jgi:hypothetical protein